MTLTVETAMAGFTIVAGVIALVWRAATKMSSIETKLDTVMVYLGLDSKQQQPLPRAQVVRIQPSRKKASRR